MRAFPPWTSLPLALQLHRRNENCNSRVGNRDRPLVTNRLGASARVENVGNLGDVQ
jgi:hypothetical protein